MDAPGTNVPEGWRRLQDPDRRGRVFDPFLTPAAILRTHVLRALHRRSFVIVDNGYIGIAPDEAQETDIAVMLAGSSTPICLRPQGSHYKWVGAMYLHGLMREDVHECFSVPEGGRDQPYPREFEVC